ncbi:hypothetical protein D3C81_811300 [compost metagenome]
MRICASRRKTGLLRQTIVATWRKRGQMRTRQASPDPGPLQGSLLHAPRSGCRPTHRWAGRHPTSSKANRPAARALECSSGRNRSCVMLVRQGPTDGRPLPDRGPAGAGPADQSSACSASVDSTTTSGAATATGAAAAGVPARVCISESVSPLALRRRLAW